MGIPVNKQLFNVVFLLGNTPRSNRKDQAQDKSNRSRGRLILLVQTCILELVYLLVVMVMLNKGEVRIPANVA